MSKRTKSAEKPTKEKLKSSKEYFEIIDELIKKEFNVSGKKFKTENEWRYNLNNKWLCRYINYFFKVPFGRKSEIIYFPNNLKKYESEFWRGIMDTDGFIDEKTKSIKIKSNSNKLIKQFEIIEKTGNYYKLKIDLGKDIGIKTSSVQVV